MPQRYIDFAYVKEHASFTRVSAGYNLKLLGTGSQRSLLCPFHPERKPSCKIDLDRNIWHCFGCEAKGNILEFVARLEGDAGDLRAAALKIAEICGIATAAPRERTGATAPVPEHRGAGARAQRTKGSPRRAHVAKAWAAANDDGCSPAGRELTKRRLHGGAAAEVAVAQSSGAAAVNPPLAFALKLDPTHPYLGERGLPPAMVAEFGLGYCSRGLMAGRICIPIHNERGELVAYAGRWPGEEPPDGEDRYKLPQHFEKARVLFNLHRASAGEHLVLVEGYWSAIRLHTLGIPAAALMGWSVSPEQIALLSDHGIRFATLLLDGDDAGRRGRERVLPGLASTLFVRAQLLPDGQKPDTLPEPLLRQLVAFGAP